MHQYGSFALAALAATAVATPIEHLAKRGTFSLKQVAGAPKPPVPFLMRRTYAKFGAVMPDSVASAAAAAETGSVAAVPEPQDVEYLCPVTVGGTTMNLNLDTGSADLWVYSTLQPKSQQTGHSIYDPTKTGGKKLSGYTWRISYGDGSGASGSVYTDKVEIGGVTAASQAIEAASTVSAQFLNDTNTDGLVGLAFSKINTISPKPQTTFFDTVKSQLAAQVFAVTLRKGVPGTYDFGFIDSAKYTGEINYVPANNTQGYWGLAVDNFKLGSTVLGAGGRDSIVDTGTTLAYLPDKVVIAFYAKVTGAKYDTQQGAYTLPCKGTTPNLDVIIGGKAQTILGSNIAYQPLSTGSSTCYGGVQSNTGIGLTILGDIFLKSHYVVHDVSGSAPRLGFAVQAGTSSGGGDSPAPTATATPVPTPTPAAGADDDNNDDSWWWFF